MIIKKRKKTFTRRGRKVKSHTQRYHVEPMRPQDSSKVELGKNKIHEPKYDGTRLFVITEPRDTKIINRRFVDKSRLYPELNNLHKEIGPGLWLDGEGVNITKKEPYGSFEGLSHRDRLKEVNDEMVREHPITFVAFDILRLKGKNIMGLPLRERKRILRMSVPRRRNIKPIETYSDPPERQMKKAGAEGIVSKDLDSTYKPGKTSREWIKKKFKKTADVKVLGLTPGAGKRKNYFGAMRVGVLKKGRMVEVAAPGTGFTDKQLHDIKKHTPKYASIRYRRIGSGGRMIEPVYLGPRNDIRDKDTHL